MRIALAGNPNSGKTTLYNALTGSQEHVGNWSGVTVSKKESMLKAGLGKDIEIVDLPGAYSIRPYTSEESITTEFVKGENPDVIINVVDSTNLEKSLFFTTQLLSMGIPVVIALNKWDLAESKTNINIQKLEQELSCKAVAVSAMKNSGLQNLISQATKSAQMKEQKDVFENLQSLGDEKQQDKERFNQITKILSRCEQKIVSNNEETTTDKIDKVVTNPIVGLALFIAVMTLIFDLSINKIGPMIADQLVALIETGQAAVADALANAGANDFLNALLTDGIIGGVGAVIGFVPLIMVLMFLLALLEDSGFMARIALIFDPLFRKIGLSGKSIIPMVVGYGCAIPGIMASRTVKDDDQRRMTALMTPFVPCGAKIPIIALFTAAFFPTQAYMFPLTYLVAFVIILCVGFTLKATIGAKNVKNYFIVELPKYSVPSLKRAFFRMCDTAKDFIIRAGTIIVICNTAVFIMSSFDMSLKLVGDAVDTSILATVATPFAYLLMPIGLGAWQLAAAAVTGFIAKEEVVGTLAVVYSMGAAINEDFELVNGALLQDTMGITSVAALAFMFFNLFTPPCFAAMGAMKSEMKSKQWFRRAVVIQFGVGYLVALVTYQFGTLIAYKQLGTAFVPAMIILVASILFIIKKVKDNNKKSDDKVVSHVVVE